ncbi:MAG TPA: hypothetical protein VGE08_05785 [Steroidobacter sp.]|uniref:hypothetical protein n=1 Tax=Steroidobacter sp. TaxID=1978227 RepID=UPI002EDB1064
MPAKRSAEAQLGLPEYRGHSRIERLAFGLLVLFIAGALLGLFGDGPLSHTTATSADGQVRIDYQRFCRRVTPQLLDITFPVPAGADSIELAINDEYLHGVQITETFPQPVESSQGQSAGKLRFRTEGNSKSMSVRVHLRALEAGLLDARLQVGPPGRPKEVSFRQIVYP